jgi:hypothetical protein
MNWLSSNEVISKLDLHPEGDSPEEILTCLRRELAALHPDKTDGKFASAAAEERWHKLTSAREYIESIAHRQLAVIPINELPSLIKSLREAAQEPIAVRSSRLVAESRVNIKQKTLFPKLTSGAFAGICAFLVAASGSLKDHPLFGQLLSHTTTQVVLLILMGYAAMFFVFFWMREGRAERYLEWLLTAEGTHAVLSSVLQTAESTKSGHVFTFRDLVNAVFGYRRTGPRKNLSDPISMLVGSRYVDRPLAEKTAQLILDRLKDEGLVLEMPRRGLNQRFQVSTALAKEIAQPDADA